MTIEICVEGAQDLGLVVVDHPPALFELPFAPGEGFGNVGAESGEEGRVSGFEVRGGGEGRHDALEMGVGMEVRLKGAIEQELAFPSIRDPYMRFD